MTYRPQKLEELIGQEGLKKRVRISVEAAKKEQRPFPHLLLSGPPGLGKTTVARIIAKEMDVECREANGGNIRSVKDIIPFINHIKHGSVLFIDEIHRMPIKVEEFLYPVIEDFKMVIVDDDREVCSIKLKPFTLVGATTIAGRLSAPLRDRFKLHEELSLYSTDDLNILIKHNAEKLKVTLSDDATKHLARMSRGTPRIGNKILEWIRDCVISNKVNSADKDFVVKSLAMRGIDINGLGRSDRQYIKALKSFSGPTGLKTISATANIDADTIAESIEPHLLRLGIIERTPKGRILKCMN